LPDHRYDSIEEWKKGRGIDPSTRIFQVHGAFPSIRKALLKRGWVENEDPNSPFWDFKYAIRKKDLNIDLNDPQLDNKVVNYFSRNQEYTTKIRLCRNLENLVFLEDVTADTIVPRTYDLSSPGEVEAFVEHFKTNHCVSILMGHVRRKGSKSFSDDIVQVAKRVLKKKGKHLDDLLDEAEGTDLTKITAVDWALLERVNLERPTSRLPAYRRRTSGLKTKRRKKKKKFADEKEEVSEAEEDEEINETQKFLDACLEKDPQESLVGENNLWIMKPASLSRGRGIFVTNRLEEALDCAKGKEAMWMAQRYIERPLLIQGKKFDIRQWVMVTSWQQLGVWFYEDAYLRFSFDDFDASDQRNKLAHLTNYSVCKHAKNFEEKRDETMMHSDDFATFLKDLDGTDLWKEKIQPAMKRAAYLALLSCQETAAPTSARENSFEFLGFDFMVDTSYNVWLLEINSSPDLSYSTAVTRKLVQQVLPDVIKVTIDCEKMGLPSNKKPTWSKKYLSDIDSGRWTLLEPARRRKEIRASANAVHGDQMSTNALSLVGSPARIYKPKCKRQIFPTCAIRSTKATKTHHASASRDGSPEVDHHSNQDSDDIITPAPSPPASSTPSSSTNLSLSSISKPSEPGKSKTKNNSSDLRNHGLARTASSSSSSSRSLRVEEERVKDDIGMRALQYRGHDGGIQQIVQGKGHFDGGTSTGATSQDVSIVSTARSANNFVSDASIEGLESECSTAANSVVGGDIVGVGLSINGREVPYPLFGTEGSGRGLTNGCKKNEEINDEKDVPGPNNENIDEVSVVEGDCVPLSLESQKDCGPHERETAGSGRMRVEGLHDECTDKTMMMIPCRTENALQMSNVGLSQNYVAPRTLHGQQTRTLEGGPMRDLHSVRKLRRLEAFDSRKTSKSTVATNCSTDGDEQSEHSAALGGRQLQLPSRYTPFHSTHIVGEGIQKPSLGRLLVSHNTQPSLSSDTQQNDAWGCIKKSLPPESPNDLLRRPPTNASHRPSTNASSKKSSEQSSKASSARSHVQQRRVLPMATVTVEF